VNLSKIERKIRWKNGGERDSNLSRFGGVSEAGSGPAKALTAIKLRTGKT